MRQVAASTPARSAASGGGSPICWHSPRGGRRPGPAAGRGRQGEKPRIHRRRRCAPAPRAPRKALIGSGTYAFKYLIGPPLGGFYTEGSVFYVDEVCPVPHGIDPPTERFFQVCTRSKAKAIRIESPHASESVSRAPNTTRVIAETAGIVRRPTAQPVANPASRLAGASNRTPAKQAASTSPSIASCWQDHGELPRSMFGDWQKTDVEGSQLRQCVASTSGAYLRSQQSVEKQEPQCRHRRPEREASDSTCLANGFLASPLSEAAEGRPGASAPWLPDDLERISRRKLLERREVEQAPGRAGGLSGETALRCSRSKSEVPPGAPPARTVGKQQQRPSGSRAWSHRQDRTGWPISHGHLPALRKIVRPGLRCALVVVQLARLRLAVADCLSSPNRKGHVNGSPHDQAVQVAMKRRDSPVLRNNKNDGTRELFRESRR